MLLRSSTVPPESVRPYAEVIGDPIGQSRSPTIHNHWLERLGITGDYRRHRVTTAGLSGYIRERRGDRHWRGCNVTIPHKEAVLAYVDALASSAASVGAANCVVSDPSGLTGYNTDIDGIAAALKDVPIHGHKIAIIGGGGAARAAIAWLADQGAGEVVVLVRDTARATPLRTLFSSLQIASLEAAAPLLPGASAVINASPLGMTGAPPMPGDLLNAVHDQREATLFDMVYSPVDTAFLQAGSARLVDGLTMLIGQAARGFELFFGVAPPPPDQRLRELLLA